MQSWNIMKKTWTNVPCELVVEIEIKDGKVWDVSRDLPASKLDEYLKGIPDGDGELIIELHCSGYYEPMSMYGGADRMGWPEEGEQEFELANHPYVLMDGKKLQIMGHWQEIFDYFYDEIQEIEVSNVPN